ncbi:collectin-12-like isoform X2 [Montipora foliosa]|uniref:collectin-12-like isoform X2 n=1 Tax=Montipora foliosa TaxID=591990 RepID=UPI0035F1D3FF
MAFRLPATRVPPRPEPRPKQPSGKLNFFVVSPVFQNWCQDGDERSNGALITSQVGKGHKVSKNFEPAQRESYGPSQMNKWNVTGDRPSIHESHVDLTVAETNFRSKSANRMVVILMILICFVSVTSLALTIMMLLGKVGSQCVCKEKQGSTSTRTQEARSSANTEFLAKMKLLEQNVTYLHQTLETRSERLMELEMSYKVLRAENEIFRNLMVNSSHFELLERRFNKLEGNYKHFTDTFQELSANVTVCRSVADQTAKKLENFQIRTNNSFSIWNHSMAMLNAQDTSLTVLVTDLNRTVLQKLNDTNTKLDKKNSIVHTFVKELNASISFKLNRADSRIDKKTNNLQLLLDEFNTKMSRKLNQLHSYLTTVNSMSNRTERTVNAFKNSTEDSLASVYAKLRSIVQDVNKTREDLWRSILNTSNELKQERDRLDQEDADLRTLLTGTNITLFAKVENVSKLQGPVGPPGFNGSQGSIGPSGPRGFNGTQGIQGSIGPRGFNGSQGPAGPAGPQGPEGAGNFSLCQYMTTEETLSQTPIASNIHNAPVQVIQAEPARENPSPRCCTVDQEVLGKTNSWSIMFNGHRSNVSCVKFC